jgi:Ca-activated chloride channel family protein
MGDLSFASPGRLWLLAIPAALVVVYAGLQVQRRVYARRFATPALLKSVVPNRAGGWRHLLAGLFVVVAVIASLGAARPVVPGTQQRKQATIMIAIDVSDSMAATDVQPDRIRAAVAAAKSFIADLPSSFDVGLATAGAAPSVVVVPTTDHQSVMTALGNLKLSPGTALGESIFTSLSALPTPDNPNADRAARIVLLSDGVTTTGRPDSQAIAAAKQARVPVSTIAFGTANATVMSQGQTVSVPVDKTALKAIADGTGGRFFEATTLNQLNSIYDQIDAEVTTVVADKDVAEWFAGIAFVLLAAAVALSMVSTSRAAWA